MKLIAHLFAFCSFLAFAVVPAQAQKQQRNSANTTAITGVYNGTYRCAHGPVNLRLTFVAPGDGSLSGVFTFDLPANSIPRTASYTLIGTYDAATGKFRLDPDKWVPPEPANYVMVGMDGAFNSSAEQVSGKITGGYGACTTFGATRDKAQTAALSKRIVVTQVVPAVRSAPANATSMSRQTSSTSAVGLAPVAPVAQPRPAVVAGQSASAQPQKQQGGGWWWYCTSGPYMTGVFFYPADITTRTEVDAAIKMAWSNHVTREYPNQNLGTGCTLGGTDQASTQRIHDHVRASQRVVDVDWKYVPGRDVLPQPKDTKVYYCSAYFGPNGGENLAFSDSFEAPKGTDINSVRDDFVKFVREKYSAKDANGGCSSNDKAKEAHDMRSKKIIETGWKPVASGKGKPSYCFGYNGNTGYFSDIFEVPPHTPLYPVMEDFARFVIKGYGLEPGRSGTGSWDGGVNCPQSDNKDPDKQYGIKKRYKIIETGWKPKSLPPPNPSPA